MEKTREWIKDLALIVGHSVKSGVGRGRPHDEEQPLLPEQAHNPRVRHAALAHWKRTALAAFPLVSQEYNWDLLVCLSGGAGLCRHSQEQASD